MNRAVSRGTPPARQIGNQRQQANPVPRTKRSAFDDSVWGDMGPGVDTVGDDEASGKDGGDD